MQHPQKSRGLRTARLHRERRRYEERRIKSPRRAGEEEDRSLRFVLESCPGYNLGKAYKKVTRRFEEEFRSSELTLPQFAVLVNTGITDSATGSEIARRLGSDLSTISRTMDIVVRRGLVKERRGKDRRVRIYALTTEGRAALRETLPKWRRIKSEVLGGVDPEAWQITLSTLRKLSG